MFSCFICINSLTMTDLVFRLVQYFMHDIYHKPDIFIFIYLLTGHTTFLKDYISAFMPFKKGILLLLDLISFTSNLAAYIYTKICLVS
jgi:hypothetical protein